MLFEFFFINTGPGQLEMKQCPSDQHLRRIVCMLNVNQCRDLAIYLGLETTDWEDIEYRFQNDNVNNIKFMAVWIWKQKTRKPSFQHLCDAFKECNHNIHCICQV